MTRQLETQAADILPLSICVSKGWTRNTLKPVSLCLVHAASQPAAPTGALEKDAQETGLLPPETNKGRCCAAGETGRPELRDTAAL